MKKKNQIGYLLLAAVILLLATGCGPLQQRLADGTAAALGYEVDTMFAQATLDAVGDGADDSKSLSPEEMATALAETLAAYTSQTPQSSPTFTWTPLPTESPTATASPTPTQDPNVTPTVPGYQFTALAQTLTAMVTTPGAEDATPAGEQGTGGGDQAEETPTPIPVEPNACNSFRFVAHVTYPLGSIVEPETYFYKSWQVQNTGNCTWNSNYALVHYDGYQMGGASPQVFGGTVAVSTQQYVTLTIHFYTPPQPGTYNSYWFLRDSSGNLFGGGENGDEPLLLQVVVPGQSAPIYTDPISTAPPFVPAP
ncbi:MAG: NBR1-Ig-like domain-containing protein [Chloroflexota bacterium]